MSNQTHQALQALFISDLHLKAGVPAITAAFLDFLKRHAIQAKQLYLLGDIFEYWAGDDDMHSPFLQPILQALRDVSNSGVDCFWIAGNRDFLVGAAFAEATQFVSLTDPYIFDFATRRYVITHGDHLCTDDIAYQKFRTQVRQPQWQAEFLARSLAERKAVIANAREQSRQHQQQMQQAESIMDVNPQAVANLFAISRADIMIHGHTHRPALHQHEKNLRYVLSDWDQDNQGKLRGDWLALRLDGSILRIQPGIQST